MLFDLRHPVLNCREGFSIGNVISHNYAVCSLVVARGDCLKAFLAGCVPNLKLDCLLIYVDCPDLKVDTDGGHKVVRENIVLASQS